MPTRFVEHKGRQIVLMDFSRLQTIEESLVHIEEARRFVAAQPKVMNLRVVVDVTDSPFDNSVIEALQRLADHDRPGRRGQPPPAGADGVRPCGRAAGAGGAGVPVDRGAGA